MGIRYTRYLSKGHLPSKAIQCQRSNHDAYKQNLLLEVDALVIKDLYQMMKINTDQHQQQKCNQKALIKK